MLEVVPESTSDPDEPRPRLRADAERNRERIVAAARAVFAERGLDAPIEDVAKRAGVGVATLYRRFPTRADLVAGAFEATMSAHADAVDQALARDDAWEAFREFILTVCAMQAADRGVADVLTMTFPTARQFEEQRIRAYEGLVELIERAKATGRLRADFSPEDLVIVLMANAGVINATGADASYAWRRLVGYLLQSFATAAASEEPLPPAPKPRELYRALIRLGRPR